MSFATDYTFDPRPGETTVRGLFVPPWYRPHTDLSLLVKTADGRNLGFPIGEVAVERRWAIAEDGTCLDQRLFEQKLGEWRRGQFQWQMPPKAPPDLSFEVIPAIETYVARGPDPANDKRLIDITRPVFRTPLLRPTEPIVDERITKDPRWRAAPKKEEPPAPEPSPEPVAAAAPAPARKTIAKVECPDCGHMVGGKNGLRLHRKFKHKDQVLAT